ncbi:MAG: hypothetical protein KBC62_01645 [Candidatus Pacebacteria bacterium]|nr:hypothetical protein [Candidatus Paceibacterota bacterium]MBP9842684.1 hypothetical protein [Candidatus Paceibacterota bacterium]
MNKKILIIAGIVIALILAFVGYRQFFGTPGQDPASVEQQTITNEEFGLSFNYPAGEGGFALVEPPATGNIKKAYILMPTSDYADFQSADEATETPASISMLVFMLEDENEEEANQTGTSTERESRITRLQNWAMDNNILTSFNTAKATPDIIEIDGVKALHYQADGLYQQDIYLASYRGRVYMFTAQYNDVDDITITSFPSFIESISFD